MSLAGVLERGRRAAEAIMSDACTIARPGARGAFNATTGTYADSDESAVYSGKCRIQSSNVLDPRSPEFGGREITTQEVTVSVPMSAEGIEVGDEVTVTACEFDSEMVGRSLKVEGLVIKSHSTARRLRCEVVTDG